MVVMTELSFLLELLLNHKLPKKTKDAVAERIKVVENGIIPQPTAIRAAPMISSRMPPAEPIIPPQAFVPNAIPLPKADIDKETGRAVVPTGNGTRGPRKF